jgi:hypothetical protein
MACLATKTHYIQEYDRDSTINTALNVKKKKIGGSTHAQIPS